MKHPNAHVIKEWGGVFPPEFFAEIDQFLIARQFQHCGVDSDGRLTWSRMCNSHLEGTLIIEIDKIIANSVEVAFITGISFKSRKVYELFQKIQKELLVSKQHFLGFGKGASTLIAGTLDYYDAELHPGEHHLLRYNHGHSSTAIETWKTRYLRTAEPLFAKLDDTLLLLDLFCNISNVKLRATGRASLVSIDPELFSIAALHLLGRDSEALGLLEQVEGEVVAEARKEQYRLISIYLGEKIAKNKENQKNKHKWGQTPLI